MSTPQTPALVESNSLSETLLEIAAKHGNAASVDIVASYAAALSDSGRNALMQAIAECYPSNKPAPFGVWQPIETAPKSGEILVWIDVTELAWPGYIAGGEVYSHAHGLLNRESRLNPGAAPIVASWWMPLPTPPPEKTA